MSQITIIQLATPGIDTYAVYSIASAHDYAKRHGYHLLVQRSKTLMDLHINWTKIDIMKSALADHLVAGEDKFLVLLDADTVIVDPERTIESFIENYGNHDSAIFMASDTPFRIDFKRRPNAGFVIVRNNSKGREIIDRWIHAAYHEGSQYNDIHPRNQLVYWNCVEPYVLDHQVVLPRRFFHKPLWWVPKPLKNQRFLYHITSTNVTQRTDQMKRLYNQFCGEDLNLADVREKLEKKQKGLLSIG